MKHFFLLLFISIVFFSCKEEHKKPKKVIIPEKIVYKFGYKLNDYLVTGASIEKGESFGVILTRHHVDYPKILEISTKAKDIFDVRMLKVGKPYMILSKKDSTEKAQVFIYQHDLINYSTIELVDDEIVVRNSKRKVKTVIKKSSGYISSSLSEALDSQGINPSIAHELSEIYAWSIDFFRLQKKDNFKVIYEQKYIEDTIPAGVGKIKAAYFEHSGKPFYAFSYITDTLAQFRQYYDENGNQLKKPFLKAPLQFSRISSRYNLNRKIAFYGTVRAHKGTDFAAPIGSPIMSTANGRVIESARKGGNGNYVKIRHNSTYTTQYLHMSRRKVNVGEYVKQGDVIGWVGMTGNTSGPHVCYRFWKNGVQVDPLKEKLPNSVPMDNALIPKYLKDIEAIKKQLDNINYKNNKL